MQIVAIELQIVVNLVANSCKNSWKYLQIVVISCKSLQRVANSSGCLGCSGCSNQKS